MIGSNLPNGFAQKVLVLGFLCATSVSSVSLWCGFTRNSSTTEDTEVAQRSVVVGVVGKDGKETLLPRFS